jgi:hypothetical protein
MSDHALGTKLAPLRTKRNEEEREEGNEEKGNSPPGVVTEEDDDSPRGRDVAQDHNFDYATMTYKADAFSPSGPLPELKQRGFLSIFPRGPLKSITRLSNSILQRPRDKQPQQQSNISVSVPTLIPSISSASQSSRSSAVPSMIRSESVRVVSPLLSSDMQISEDSVHFSDSFDAERVLHLLYFFFLSAVSCMYVCDIYKPLTTPHTCAFFTYF